MNFFAKKKTKKGKKRRKKDLKNENQVLIRYMNNVITVFHCISSG